MANPARSSFPRHFQVCTKDVLGVDVSRLASPAFTYFSWFWRFPPELLSVSLFSACRALLKNTSEILSHGLA